MATTSPAMAIDNVAATKDKDWVRSSFMLAVNRWNPRAGRLHKQNKEWLYFTSANYKVSNTSLGGNHTINSLAQFTPLCDIPRGGLTMGSFKNYTGVADKSMLGGMGRYYSESIDDWSQKISFRFGMPEYKGLITFFTSFYDVGAALLGSKGRLNKGLFYTAAKIITGLIALPFTVLVWVGEAVQWLAARPSSRYYNMKPAMALYWQRVNLIANMLAANMGLIPRGTSDPKREDVFTEFDPRFSFSKDESNGSYAYDQFRTEYPGMFMKYGGVDIYALATKFTRMHDARAQAVKKMMEDGGKDWLATVKRDIDKQLATIHFNDTVVPGESLDKYLSEYHASRLGWADLGDMDLVGNDSVARKIAQGIQKTADGSRLKDGGTSVNTVAENGPGAELSEGATQTEAPPEGEAPVTESNPYEDMGNELVKDSADDGLIYPVLEESEPDPAGGTLYKRVGGWLDGFADYSKAVAKDGGQWINFRVDAVKTVDESFTNNVGPSEIEGKINGMSSSAAAVRFGLSDFQTGAPILDDIVDTVRDTFLGIADGLHIGGLAALMGGGFVDIPQRWMDSATSFPTASYTIKCRPPYGNVMSRFLNMHVPLACLLAAALPVSYGRHSYGSPMLCEFYVQGKNQSRLAMITSLSVTRGEGSLGWSKDGEFLGCDINFEVTDLSTVMHAPIDTGMGAFSLRWVMSDDNVFNDYMAVLSNLSVAEMSYSWEKLKHNWNKYKTTQQSFISPSRVAMVAGDGSLGRFYRKITPGENPSVR